MSEECIDCGATVYPPEKYCEDCKVDNNIRSRAEQEQCTCWCGICIKHGDKNET